ncbi:MAG: translesion error-prone DNA polymerase V autoproteolytic subunit [Spirochaetota bacterium]
MPTRNKIRCAIQLLHGRLLPLQGPLYLVAIKAGFPSPADDYIEKTLDLNEYLIHHPAATFFVRVSGDSMAPLICHGDILVVDKALTPASGNIVIAAVDGELTVKRLVANGETMMLVPDNEAYQPIALTPQVDCTVWGVVVHIIRTVV